MWTRRNPLLASSLVVILIVALLGLAGIVWQWREAVAARNLAQEATDRRREQLWESLGHQAHFSRLSRQVGQRTNALAALALAAAIRPSLELRNDAIATLLLPDLGAQIHWKPQPDFLHPWCYDPDLEHYLPHVERGRVTVHRALDDQVVADLGEAPVLSNTAVFSPDGRFVAVMFDDGLVRVWEWRASRLAAQVRCSKPIWGLRPYDFSPDSRSLFYGDEILGVSRVSLDTGTSEPLVKTKPVRLLRVSPSGRLLAVARKTEVEVWDVSTARLITTTNFSSVKPPFLGLAWHPNEELLALSGECSLFLWPWREGEATRLPDDGEGQYHYRPFFNSTGDLLLSSVGVWDVASRQRLLTFGSTLDSIALSCDERRIAGTKGRVGFGLWEFLPPTVLRRFVTTADSRVPVPALDLHPDGRWLLAGGGAGWTLWDVESARAVARDPEPVPRPRGVVTVVKFAPDGDAFHTIDHHGVRRWPLQESQGSGLKFRISVGEPEALLLGLPVAGAIDTNRPLARQLLSLAQSASTVCQGGSFAADGRSAALLGDGQAALFDLEPRALLPFVSLRNPRDNIIALSPDGRWLVTTHNNQPGGPDVYDLREGRHAGRLAQAEKAGFVWQPQTGELVTQSSVEALYWQPGAWKVQYRFPWSNSGMGIGFAGFSPDGHTGWLNGTAGTLQLVDLAKGEIYATLPPLPSQHLHPSAIVFDAPRQRAYLAHVHGVLVLDLAGLRRELARLGLDWRDDHPSGSFSPRQP